MAKKFKVCKDSGLLVDLGEDKCPITGSDQFVEKYKGSAIIFDVNTSKIAEKMKLEHKGRYALKY